VIIPETIVVKFGGSCLSTPASISKAASKVHVEARKGRRIVVIVSALSGVTDSLIKMTNEATGNKVSREDMDQILSMGERTAVPIVVGALRSLGLNAAGVDPMANVWPIFTNSVHGSAEVDMQLTKEKVSSSIMPMLERGEIPVFPGFIGLSPQKRITTLGRGGSDITAVVLGTCLDANEVIFVKDVAGVLTADPKKVNGARRIELLNAEEAFILTHAGAKILHPAALRYKTESLVLRVVGFDEPDLSGGTIIEGEVKTDLRVAAHESALSMITLVGHEVSTTGSVLSVLSETLSDSNLIGMTLEPSSLLIYVQDSNNLVERLHEKIKTNNIAKAIHYVDSLAMITITGPELEKIPGIVDMIVSPLSRNKINLYGVLTISSSVKVFVPWNERQRAVNLVNEELSQFKEKRRIQ